MKISIPFDDIDNVVCVSFGRTPCFMIHDTDTGLSEVLENPAAEAAGGAGLKAAQFVVDSGASALITIRCGENAAEVLKAANIGIFEAKGQNADENIAAFKDGALSELTHFTAGFHGVR